MSKFFSVTHSNNGNLIDDLNISTDSTYSSFQINNLLQEITNLLVGCDFIEYKPGVRASPQTIFETPDSSQSHMMWVLREGVKMSEGIDYEILDSTHIRFIDMVSPLYTISIFVIGTGGLIPNNSTSPTVFIQSEPTTNWEIQHNKGFKYPRITLVDHEDNILDSSVNIQYINDSSLVITSELPFYGKCIIY